MKGSFVLRMLLETLYMCNPTAYSHRPSAADGKTAAFMDGNNMLSYRRETALQGAL